MDQVLRGPPCGQDGCPETHFYLDNGLWFCRSGHQQEGRQRIVDDDDFGSQGRVLRQKRTPSEKTSRVYTGSQGYQLFLEAYQLILWKQCHALVHRKGFPDTTESLVKDLWSLRLQSLSKSRPESLSDDTASEVFSSQTEQSSTIHEEESRYHAKRIRESPKLIDTVALCYLAVLLLRIPLSIGMLEAWILRDEIPLLRAMRHVPQIMRDRLPATYHNVLDTQNVRIGERLHRSVADLIVVYHHHHDLEFPPINSALLTFSYIRQLSLPLDVYVAMKPLQSLLKFPFTFPQTRLGAFHQINIPEVQLISLLIITVKLIFPFDDITRHAYSSQDPAAYSVNWLSWKHAQETQETGDRTRKLGPDMAIQVREEDVFEMSKDQLDDYMDWYEKMFVQDKEVMATHPVADIFPPGRTGSRTQASNGDGQDGTTNDSLETSNLRKVLETLNICPISNDGDGHGITCHRPGYYHRRYRKPEELAGTIRSFHVKASKVAGISLQTLLASVYATETKMAHLADANRD